MSHLGSRCSAAEPMSLLLDQPRRWTPRICKSSGLTFLLMLPRCVCPWPQRDLCHYFCRGTFRFERPDGSHFDVRIPPFSLESNKDEKTPPSGLHW